MVNETRGLHSSAPILEVLSFVVPSRTSKSAVGE